MSVVDIPTGLKTRVYTRSPRPRRSELTHTTEAKRLQTIRDITTHCRALRRDGFVLADILNPRNNLITVVMEGTEKVFVFLFCSSKDRQRKATK